MKFNIFYLNHNTRAKKSILDFVEWFYFKLKKRGYAVNISKKIDTNSINLIIDNFNFETSEFLFKHNIKYGIILTEILTGDSMNYEGSKIWKTRRANFDQSVKNALFVFTMGPMDDLKLENKYEPVFLEYLDEIKKKYNCNLSKMNNFCYTGPINNFRKKIINQFIQFDNVEVCKNFLSKRQYAYLAQRSKYFLCIQQSKDWPTVSITKIMTALHNNCIPVLLKMPKSNFNEISDFAVQIDMNNLENEIKRLINHYDQYKIILDKYKKFKSKYNFYDFIEKNTSHCNFNNQHYFINSSKLSNSIFHLGWIFFYKSDLLLIKKNNKNHVILDDMKKKFFIIQSYFLIKFLKIIFKKIRYLKNYIL